MSGRKPAVRLTENAERDVATILFHTRRTWGGERRAVYRASIFRAFDHLRDHPHIGLRRDDLLPGCRSLSVEQHVSYHHLPETSSDDVEVLRILHVKQNPERAFRDRSCPNDDGLRRGHRRLWMIPGITADADASPPTRHSERSPQAESRGPGISSSEVSTVVGLVGEDRRCTDQSRRHCR